MKLGFSQQIFEKYSNIKLDEYPSSGSWLFHADGRTDVDMTKLGDSFRNFANKLNKTKRFWNTRETQST
jgi:hypothetical protein